MKFNITKQQLNDLGRCSYSKALLPSKLRTANVQRAVSKTAPPSLAHQLLSNRIDAANVIAINNGKIQVLTMAVQSVNENGQKVCGMSFGDAIGQPYPVVGPNDLTDHRVVSITSLKKAQELDLPVSTTMPLTMTIEAEDDKEQQVDLAHLKWEPFDDESGTPVFVFLPMVLPVPMGVPLPSGDLASPNIPEDMNCPLVATWLETMQYLHTNNGGLSLTNPDSQFLPGEQVTPPVDPKLHDDIVMANKIDVAELLSTPPYGSSLFDEIVTSMGCLDQILLARASEELEMPLVPPSAPAPNSGIVHSGNGSDFIKLIANLSEAITSKAAPLSHSEKQSIKSSKEVKARYMIAGARETTIHNIDDPMTTGSTTMVPGRLKKEFQEFLEQPYDSRMLKNMLMNQANHDRQQDTAFASYIHLTEDQCDDFMGKDLHEGHWLSTPPNAAPSKLLTQLSVFAFAVPQASNQVFQERTTQANALATEIFVGEVESRRTTKAKTLFIGGSSSSEHALYGIASNLKVVLNMIYEDAASSKVYQWLNHFIAQLQTLRGKTFANTYHSNKMVWTNIACDMQEIFSSLFHIAEDNAMRKLIIDCEENQQVVLPKEPFAQAAAQVLEITNSLRIAINRLNISAYGTAPQVLPTLHPNGFKLNKQGVVEENNGKNNKNADSNKGGKKENDGKRNADTNNNNGDAKKPRKEYGPPQPGPLVYKGKGLFPIPNELMFKGKGGHPIQLCKNAAVDQRHCRYGKECQWFHFDKVSDLPQTESRKKLIEWVKNTDNVEWREGCGPSSGTN